jgi:hypothetical protein
VTAGEGADSSKTLCATLVLPVQRPALFHFALSTPATKSIDMSAVAGASALPTTAPKTPTPEFTNEAAQQLAVSFFRNDREVGVSPAITTGGHPYINIWFVRLTDDGLKPGGYTSMCVFNKGSKSEFVADLLRLEGELASYRVRFKTGPPCNTFEEQWRQYDLYMRAKHA